MAATWKTVRIFISSTFNDMQAERDWLVKRVFPELRQKLEPLRIHLVDIDLRWGITRDQAENDQVIGLCLQQIDECRPFFLGLLGGRYGWVPLKFPVKVFKRYGWTQHQTGKSVTELEILHGILNDTTTHKRALFCFRSERFLDDVKDEHQRRVYVEGTMGMEMRDLGPEEAEHRAAARRQQLADLKNQIRAVSPPMPLFDGYPCNWDAIAVDPHTNQPGRIGRLSEFGSWVIDKLERAILDAKELQEHLAVVRSAVRDDLAEERDFHRRYIESRTRIYIGRQPLQDELKNFVAGVEAKLCLVTGPPGSGKSAALAKFVSVWCDQHPEDIVITHFAGASPRSNSLLGMLQHLCAEVKDVLKLEDEIKQDIRELSEQFREFLAKAPANQLILIVFDALNQLDVTNNAHPLCWLPRPIPPKVRFIVSCIDDPDRADQADLAALRRRQPQEIPVGQLIDTECLAIVREIPSAAAKTLDDEQVKLLLKNEATRNPLFLLVALEELRGFGSFEQLNQKIAGLPKEGDTLTAIFQQVIRRLAEDFNPETVKDVLTLLACARRGLSERELLYLIEGENVAIEVSAGDLFPILRQLRPYLQSRGPLLDFFHRHLVKAVHEEFFARDSSLRVAAHIRLASYFRGQADPGCDQSWKGNSARPFEELPFHQNEGQLWCELVAALCDFGFLEANFRFGIVDELQNRFQSAVSSWPEPEHADLRSRVDDFRTALLQETNNLKRFSDRTGAMPFSDFLFQQMRNRVYTNSKGEHDPAVGRDLALRMEYLLLHQGPVGHFPFVRSLEADPGSNILRFCGKVRFTLDGQSIIVAPLRERIRVFDVSHGRETMTLDCIGRANAIDFLADGKLLIAAGDQGPDSTLGFLQIFDLETGQSLVSRFTDERVHDLVATLHGQIVCCCGSTIKVHSATDLTLLKEWCPYDTSAVMAIAVNRARTLVATGEYHDEKRPARISVWDAKKLLCVAEFEGQKYGITALAFSDDNRLLASGSTHLDFGVVAWCWMLPGTEWDTLLLTRDTPDRTRKYLMNDVRVRLEGRVVSTLQTSDTAISLAFYPKSTWLVGAEGSLNLTVDTINIFNVWSHEPGNTGKLCGHPSVPIALDVDPTGQWVASLHANGRVVLWPAEALKRIGKIPPPQALGDHSVDNDCKFILSRDREDHGFLYLTDTDTGQNVLSVNQVIPSLSSKIDPARRYIVIFNWAKFPINPILGGDVDLDELSKGWWADFQDNTPISCTLYSFDSLVARGRSISDLPHGHIIEDLSYDSGLARWELPLGLKPTNLLIGLDGSWGASLLKDRQGQFWLFRFNFENNKSRVEKLPWKMTAAAIFPSQARHHLGIAIMLDGISLRFIDPKRETLQVESELIGIGVTQGLTEGPFLLNNKHCLVIRDHSIVSLLRPVSKIRSIEGNWEVFHLGDERSCAHDYAIRDAVVSSDEQYLILLDAHPSVNVIRITDLKLVCRRALDREYTMVRVSRDGRRILAIGGDRLLEGVSYLLMDLIEREIQ